MRKESALQNGELTKKAVDTAEKAVLGTKLIGARGQVPFQIRPNGLVSHIIGTRELLAEGLSAKNITRLV